MFNRIFFSVFLITMSIPSILVVETIEEIRVNIGVRGETILVEKAKKLLDTEISTLKNIKPVKLDEQPDFAISMLITYLGDGSKTNATIVTTIFRMRDFGTIKAFIIPDKRDQVREMLKNDISKVYLDVKVGPIKGIDKVISDHIKFFSNVISGRDVEVTDKFLPQG